MTKQVRITLGKDGSIKTEVRGAKGPECEKMTAFVDELFGQAETRRLKESYHEKESTTICDGLPSGWCG